MSHWCFFCASVKLTHRYNTRANHLKILEHLEQENRDLKEDIARLTSMMETDISEVATSTIPATVAHFAPNMPAKFPWGMAPNFMPEGFAHTFASMQASSPVMSVPHPIVHTLPRVEDTIYHSEPYEGLNMYAKMDEMKDQFLELRKELKI
ncbi:hypothetical protein KIW84_050315 [Lathyrus oleraceus]|uniref:Uncharacterized protein n=1 Tax=Pisum sativum TaxID=3888 RepID=A0A9D5AC99_PEA|nr:hypothetical protein KIW84_050315 [Pisum sativum]